MTTDLYVTEEEVLRLEDRVAISEGEQLAQCLIALAWACRQRDSKRALTLADRAEVIVHRFISSDERHAAAGRLALIRSEIAVLMGDYVAPDKLLKSAADWYTTIGDSLGQGDVEMARVLWKHALGDRAGMFEACQSSLEHYRVGYDTRRCELVEGWLAFYHSLSDPEEAKLHLAALAEANRAGNPGLDALLLATEGVLLSSRGEMVASIESHLRAGERAREAGLIRHSIISSLNACGWLQTLGDYEAASHLLNGAFELAHPTGWPAVIGLCTARLGELLRQLGQLELSAKSLREAVNWFAGAGSSANKGVTLNSLAETLLAQNRAEEALVPLLAAEDVFMAAGHQEGLVSASINLARAYSLLDRAEETVKRLLAAEQLIESHHIKTSAIELLRAKAQMHRRGFDTAVNQPGGGPSEVMILEQALATGKAIARWRAPVDLLMELSLAWEAASDSTKALKFARAAATRALENAGLTSEAWVVATRVKYEFEKARDETAHAHRAAALERDRATILSGEVDQRRQAEAEQRSLAESLRVRTTELEFANKELESFSYSVSHDLRAPLRSIDGFSAALAEDYAANLDAIALDYIKRVRNSAQRMGELIDDMLELSHISRTDINVSRIDISALAHQIADELSGSDPERQVRFEIAPGMTARADPSLMRILMTNLLNNAFKFTAKVSGALIKFGRVAGDEETTFFVCDNGAGFDMVYADKLFAPFQRLHRVEDFAGTGIGLATVARIIARHRGRVWAEAEPGQGATFYFSIPLDATLLDRP